jgi:hypothetical protein
MYTQPWDSSYATNTGQTRGTDVYTIEYSYSYSNLTQPGFVCPAASSSSSSAATSSTPSSTWAYPNSTYSAPPMPTSTVDFTCMNTTTLRTLIPACALDCQAQALKATPCDFEDLECNCLHTGAIEAVLEPCLATSANCTTDEINGKFSMTPGI